MEYNLMNCLSYADHENDLKSEAAKNIGRESESPRPEDECPRSDTPSSDASTSGVCSMASSDFDTCVEDKHFEQERELAKNCTYFRTVLGLVYDNTIVLSVIRRSMKYKILFHGRYPVIKYLDRDVLDLCSNLYPYGLFQTTSVPKMNMTNYWNLRSIYHRLGPYGNLEEFDYEKCYNCDFYATVPKKTSD